MMRLSPVDFSMDKENSIRMPLSFEEDDDHGVVESGLHPPKFYLDETSSSQDSGVSFDRDRVGVMILSLCTLCVSCSFVHWLAIICLKIVWLLC